MTALERWNDDRLDDFYAEFKRIVVMVEKVAVIETTVRNVADDTAASRRNIHELRGDLAANAVAVRKDLADANRTQALERKTDRRWLITTILAASAVIVGLLSVLGGHL